MNPSVYITDIHSIKYGALILVNDNDNSCDESLNFNHENVNDKSKDVANGDDSDDAVGDQTKVKSGVETNKGQRIAYKCEIQIVGHKQS